MVRAPSDGCRRGGLVLTFGDSRFRELIATVVGVPSRSGPTLRKARESAGLTQGELGERAGLSKSAISMYETGAREPGADTFLRLLNAVGCRVTVTAFSDEQLRRGRVFSDLLLYAGELPHRWPGDTNRFPGEVWRS
jgi:transcriptional regulator with XRE-family HTH domain